MPVTSTGMTVWARAMFRGDLSTPRKRASAWSDSLLVDHAVFRVLWDNWAAVVPGRLYRCNHPTPARLARAARRHGIRRSSTCAAIASAAPTRSRARRRRASAWRISTRPSRAEGRP